MDDQKAKASGTETRQRNKLLQIRMTEAELAQIDTAARDAGLTAPSYARAQLFDQPAPRARRRPSVEAEQVGRLLGELGKIGSNLNQIAHHLNAGRGGNPTALDVALQDVADIRAACMKALGRKP